MKNFIAVDIGTTHCKVITINENGKPLHSSKASYPSVEEQAGQHEQDAEVIFQAVIQLLREAFILNVQNETVCVCFSAAMHGIMAIDSNGKPLTRIITWADTRSAKYAALLLKDQVSDKIYSSTGTPIHAMSPLCKLMWMKNELPGIFKKAYKFISVKEYIFYRLFGKYIIDHSIASATGLFDIYQKTWDDNALQIAGITPEQLSTPLSSTHAEKELQEEYKAVFNISDPVPFVLGANDGCLANLGCGAIEMTDAALTIGTSGAVRMVTNNPKTDTLKRTFIYLLTEDTYVTGGPSNNGGNVMQWIARTFFNNQSGEDNDLKGIISAACKIATGSEGLIFLPYIYGERAPVWDAEARGVFIGVHARHRREHFAKAAMEAICFTLYDIFQTLCDKESVEIIYASGGFTQSGDWLQMMANVFGKKIAVNDVADASAMGAAFLGMHALGVLKNLNDVKKLLPVATLYHPEASAHAVYQKIFGVYSSLYRKLKDDFEVLDQF